MSSQQDIQKVQSYLDDIENYARKGVWNHDKNLECAARLADVGLMLDQLQGDILSPEQTEIVSSLLKRFEQVKYNLPSPPSA
jgi:hypothetical protein